MFWPVREVSRALPQGEAIIVVRAYLDASGQSSDPVAVVAGFMGWDTNFESFERKWVPFLEEFGLDHFHATEFWARKSRPYSTWSNEKWEQAKHQVCEILSHVGGPPIAISVALKVQALKEWLPKLDHYYPSDPYYFCLDRALYTLMYATGPNYDGITIYCDQEENHERLAVDIARWHENRLKNDPSLATNPLSEPKPVSVLYGPKRRFVPLQLADILANDTFRKAGDYLRSGQMDDPYFTTCLKKVEDRELITYFYSDPKVIGDDYERRFRRRVAEPEFSVERFSKSRTRMTPYFRSTR